MSRYTISDLANEADVSVRTVRYYLAEGLLPSPAKRGRYARYGAEHLERLRLIAMLKDAFLPLREIRARLVGLSDRDVSGLLAAGPSADPILVRVATASPQPEADEDDLWPEIQRPSPAHWRPAVAEPPESEPGKWAQGEKNVSDASRQAEDSEDLGRYLKDRPQGQQAASQAGRGGTRSTWIRYRLEDGIELNVRMPLHPWRERILRRIMTELGQTLRDW